MAGDNRGWPVVDGSSLADTFAAWKTGVVFPLSKMTRDLLALFDNGITFTDHMNAAIIDIEKVKHGEEAFFIPPKKMKVPLTFIPIRAQTLAGVDVPIAAKSSINYAVKLANGSLRKDGNLGITIQYAPPVGSCNLAAGAANQFATGTTASLQWDNRWEADQGAMSCAIGTITVPPAVPGANSYILCAADGQVEVMGSFFWTDPGAVSRFNQCWIERSSDTSRWSNHGAQYSIAGNFGFQCAALIPVAANTQIALRVFQNSGITMGLLTGPNAARLQARYVAPLPSTTATVRGILVGA